MKNKSKLFICNKRKVCDNKCENKRPSKYEFDPFFDCCWSDYDRVKCIAYKKEGK